VALIFLLASIAKLTHLGQFENVLFASRLVPDSLVRPTAYAVPVVETFTAIALVHPRVRTAGLVGTVALSGLFLGYNCWRFVAGISAPCGCFVGLFTMSSLQMIFLDLLLLIASFLLLGSAPKRWTH
jgi:hypothetical protein